MTSYKKTAYQLKVDTDTINKHVSLLTPDVIDQIRKNADLSLEYTSSLFRPRPDQCMLLFRKNKDPSYYTINMLTLKPTFNSFIKTPLSSLIIDLFTD